MSVCNVSDQDKLFADLWMKQSDLFLKLAALIPVLELAILAGWYGLMRDDQPELARWAALLGTFVMLVALVILWRASLRIRHFRDKLGELLAGLPRSTLTGRGTAICLPAVCAIVNIILSTGVIAPMSKTPLNPKPSIMSPQSN